MDEDYWATIQNSFSVTRGIINLNNGGVSPSPRIVTEALVRYIWQQEDATAYTMWQILEPQSETIRTGLAEMFGCDREEIAITRNASESLETLLMGMDFKSGDEILTTTQDYPRMLTTLRQREKREGLKLKLIQIPIPPKNLNEITAAFEKGITDRTRLILISHMINITGQITPVKAVCDMARARGIETIVDGAHSFAQFDFKQKDLGCDYFGTSLHKWLYAPKGTGMLYVKRDKIEKIWPLMAAESKQASDIRKFEEIGTHSAAPKLAIGEALLFHNGDRRQTQGSAAALPVALLDEPAQRRAENSVQHFVRSEPVVRNRKCSHRRHQSRGRGEVSVRQTPHLHHADHARRIPGHSHHAQRLHDALRAGSILRTDGDDRAQRLAGLSISVVPLFRFLLVF